MKKLYKKLEKCWLEANRNGTSEEEDVWVERMDIVWKQLTPEERIELIFESKKELEEKFSRSFEEVFKEKFSEVLAEDIVNQLKSGKDLDEILDILEKED